MRADIDNAIDHRWGRADFIASLISPYHLTRQGLEGIELAVVGTRVDNPTGYCRRGEAITAGLEAPLQGACRGIESVNSVITRANIDYGVN